MTDHIPNAMAKVQGLGGADPNLVLRYAKQLRDAGGALILPHQMDELPPAVRAEIEKAQEKALGRRKSG